MIKTSVKLERSLDSERFESRFLTLTQTKVAVGRVGRSLPTAECGFAEGGGRRRGLQERHPRPY